MKKAAFFLAILLGITLCGCSGQKMDAAEPTEMTASESENNETPPQTGRMEIADGELHFIEIS